MRNTEHRTCSPCAQAHSAQQVPRCDGLPGSAEWFAFGSPALQASSDTFDNAGAFEFGDGAQDVHL
jgi:hypothetical protein